MSPTELGPMIRNRVGFAASSIACLSPFSRVSPAVMTTAARVPFSLSSPMTPGTARRRRDDHPEIRHARKFAGVAIAAPPRDLAVFWVDRPDLAFEAGRDDVVHHHPADRALPRRRADDGDRLRMHRVLQVPDRQTRFSSFPSN